MGKGKYTHTHTFYSHINTSEIGMSLLMGGCVLYGRVPYIFTHTEKAIMKLILSLKIDVLEISHKIYIICNII